MFGPNNFPYAFNGIAGGDPRLYPGGNTFVSEEEFDGQFVDAAAAEKLAADGVTVGLGTILVGDDPASAGYIRKKHEKCEELGIASFHQDVPASATQADLLEAVQCRRHQVIKAYDLVSNASLHALGNGIGGPLQFLHPPAGVLANRGHVGGNLLATLLHSTGQRGNIRHDLSRLLVHGLAPSCGLLHEIGDSSVHQENSHCLDEKRQRQQPDKYR